MMSAVIPAATGPLEDPTPQEHFIEFTVPLAPKGKSRPRHGKGFTYSDKDQVRWEQQFALYDSQFKPQQLLEGSIGMAVLFVMPRPKRLYRKKDSPNCLPHTGRPDLDNLVKSVMDAMSTWWHDDAQVSSILAKKCYAEKHQSPRIHTTLLYHSTPKPPAHTSSTIPTPSSTKP